MKQSKKADTKATKSSATKGGKDKPKGAKKGAKC
jgi:hypothetical protein